MELIGEYSYNIDGHHAAVWDIENGTIIKLDTKNINKPPVVIQAIKGKHELT